MKKLITMTDGMTQYSDHTHATTLAGCLQAVKTLCYLFASTQIRFRVYDSPHCAVTGRPIGNLIFEGKYQNNKHHNPI